MPELVACGAVFGLEDWSGGRGRAQRAFESPWRGSLCAELWELSP